MRVHDISRINDSGETAHTVSMSRFFATEQSFNLKPEKTVHVAPGITLPTYVAISWVFEASQEAKNTLHQELIRVTAMGSQVLGEPLEGDCNAVGGSLMWRWRLASAQGDGCSPTMRVLAQTRTLIMITVSGVCLHTYVIEFDHNHIMIHNE